MLQPSSVIQKVRVESPIVVPDNVGDTWVTVRADDGSLYAPSNDTLSFDVPEFFTTEKIQLFQNDYSKFLAELTSEQLQQFQYTPIAFNRIEGENPENLRGC